MSPEDATQPQDWGRDRRKAISEVALGPDSLVGSWFMRIERQRPSETGLVVAEVQPGAYMLDVDDAPGVQISQRLVSLNVLLGDEADDGYSWRFYDSEEAMRLAVARWMTHHERGVM